MKEMKIRMQAYPRMIQEFAAQNFNLKVLCAALTGLLFLLLVLVMFLVRQGPTVIALDETGQVARIETRVTEAQIEAAAKEYISLRYAWTADDVERKHKKAELFVSTPLLPAFRKAMAEIQKYIREKKVSQRVYPRSMKVDLKAMSVTIVADRINEFDNLKAATPMNLVLRFELDSRSPVNPWGVYITKESESEAP